MKSNSYKLDYNPCEDFTEHSNETSHKREWVIININSSYPTVYSDIRA
jgi:hypothetical protein